MKSLFNRLVQDMSGTTSIEYGVLCLCIVVAIIAALQGVSDVTIGTWEKVVTKSAEVM